MDAYLIHLSHINGFVQDCSISIALEILQSFTEPSVWHGLAHIYDYDVGQDNNNLSGVWLYTRQSDVLWYKHCLEMANC